MYDVYVDEDFSLVAEVDDHNQILLHMEVTNWNRTVLRKAKRLGKDAMEAFRLEGFVTAYTITPNPRFVKMVFGGETMDTVVHDGKNHEVIVWELD